MRSPALFAAILLGAPPSALAGAPDGKDEEISGRVSYTEPADPADDAPGDPSDWVELADPTPAKHGTVYIMVGDDVGRFGRLRLDAAEGTVTVKKVRVVFADGKARTYRVNKTIGTKARPYTLVDLGDTRAIDRVIVTTAKRAGGQYAVYGTSSGGVVAER